MVALLLHTISIRSGVQTVLPWHLNGCNSSPRLTLSRIAFGRCRPDVRTYAVFFPYLCLRRKFDFLSNTEERPDVLLRWSDGCNLEQFETSRQRWASGLYYHVFRTDVADWWASRRYTGPSGRMLGIWFLWLGNEDFEINDIPDKIATLHKSDFCQTECSQSHTNKWVMRLR